MATPSPYRSLSAERRIAVVTYAIKASKEGRAIFVQRLAGRGGFRVTTLQQWPAEKLASEIVRTKAESSNDELDLLHLLYVTLEPAIQITFLDAAGVKHDKGSIAEDLTSPYADAAGVARGVAKVHAQHGEDGMRYLRTLVRYAKNDWPGIEGAVAELETTAGIVK
jgi:hypothetical protein